MSAPKALTSHPKWTPCTQCGNAKTITRAGVDKPTGRQKFRCMNCGSVYLQPEDKQPGIDYVVSGVRGRRLSEPTNLESKYRLVQLPNFDTSLYVKLRLYATAKGITFREAAEQLIRDGLKAAREGKSSNGKDVDVWIVPKDAAPLMKALLQRIEKKD